MNGSTHNEIFEEANIFSVVGQISLLLLKKERSAGEIYATVQASQPTISRKLARMIDLGMIEQERSRLDRRVPIYAISLKYRHFLINTEAAEIFIAARFGEDSQQEMR